MPWSGNGITSVVYSWASDAANGILVRSDRMDTQDADMASMIQNCLALDGQNSPIANISWGNFKLTSLANGQTGNDAVNYAQVFTSPTFTAPKAAANPSAGDSSQLLATTQFVTNAIAGPVYSAAMAVFMNRNF